MALSDTIKTLRIKLVMEQQQLAQAIGVTKGCIANYEHGRRKPRLSVIRRLIDFAEMRGIQIDLSDLRPDLSTKTVDKAIKNTDQDHAIF